MKKNIRIVIAVIAVVCLISVLTACNKGGDMAVLDRNIIAEDFVALGLERVDENYKVNLTTAEIKTLEDPVNYIFLKNALRFSAGIMNASTIRVQKLARLNSVLWVTSDDVLFLDSEEVASDAKMKEAFKLFSDAGLTSEDIADMFSTAIIYSLDNLKLTYLQIKTEIVALKDSYKPEDFSLAEDYQDKILFLEYEIKNIDESITRYDKIISEETNVRKTIIDAKVPLANVVDAFAKIMLSFNSESMFSLSEKVELNVDSTSGETVFSFNISATAPELNAYIGGIKTNIDEISNSFSDSDIKAMTDAFITLAKLFEEIRLPIFLPINEFSSILAVCTNLFNFSSNFASGGLGAIDTTFAQNFIDIENAVYVKENYAILFAKIVKAAIGDDTATSMKADLDAYKIGLGTDVFALKKHLIGLILIGGNVFDEELQSSPYINEVDRQKIMATLILDQNRSQFKRSYFTYLQELAEGDEDFARLDSAAERIYTNIKTLSGQDVRSAQTLHSEEWYQEILTMCDNTLNSEVNYSIDSLINCYKLMIDDFFTNSFVDINELAAMGMQTTEGTNYARLMAIESETEYGVMFRNYLISMLMDKK
ncbi:MAG TPA: hypothetical protein VJZ69_01245 [Clostridia bacterium]|nr:hypothetical protein [Clostridia bacterium]